MGLLLLYVYRDIKNLLWLNYIGDHQETTMDYTDYTARRYAGRRILLEVKGGRNLPFTPRITFNMGMKIVVRDRSICST
jgi:hypothetical protein